MGANDAKSDLQPQPPDRVHVAVMRVVRRGREAEFESQLEKFFSEAARQPGVCGAYLVRPFAGSHAREYGILRSFQSERDRDHFYGSDLYRRWNDAIAPLVEGEPVRRDLHGLEAFFEGPAAPSRWKMAIVTWVGVNPAVYLSAAAVPKIFGPLPSLIELLVVNAFVVAALTWVLMPLLTRLLGPWLSREISQPI